MRGGVENTGHKKQKCRTILYPPFCVLTFLRSSVVVFCLCLCLLNLGFAQKVKVKGSSSVEISPTPQAYVDALLCGGCAFVEPSFVNSAVKLQVLRQGNRAYTLSVKHSGWVPGGAAVGLEARYTAKGNKSGTYAVTEWLPLSTVSEALLSGSDPKTDVEVEYRLRVTGDERAGTYETTVTYSVGSSSVSHRVRVVVPSATVLRVRGQGGASTALSVFFTYDGTDALSYVRAVEKGTPLPVTESSLGRVEVFTNSPKGYTVRVSIEQLDGPTDNSLSVTDITLFGEPAGGQAFRSADATDGFETLVRPDDLGLSVNGDEVPESYVFTLRYAVATNP